MPTSPLPPNPDNQPHTPNAPPGATSKTPIPAQGTLTTHPPSSPAGHAELDRARSFYTGSAYLMLLACPAVALAPPRKVDLFTLGLAGAWCISAGFVLEQRTGHGLLWHVGYRVPATTAWGREERERLARQQEAGDAERQLERAKQEGAGGMGRTREWVERAKEREESWIDHEGKGYGGIVGEYIKEAIFGGDEEEGGKKGK